MKSAKYSHAFGCYGMPVEIKIIVRGFKGIAKEGKQLKPCKQCINSACSFFRDAVETELKKIFEELQ